MPTNQDFTLSIRVGGTTLPEYHKYEVCYIESNLFTPFSYQQEYSEIIQGENETQKWPVTPFVIAIQGKTTVPQSYYRVFVDGQLVKKMSIPQGKTRLVKGFRDGNNCVEFLFSLPRFCRGEDDKLTTDKVSRVGLIEVECYRAVKMGSFVTRRKKDLLFDQANKKDCLGVTQGQYLMATTKAGKVLKKRSTNKMTDHWDVGSMRSRQSVKYVTSQTLVDLGVSVLPIPFPTKSRPVLCSSTETITKQEATTIDIKQEIIQGSSVQHSGIKFLV
ncbi:uncharacterized protein LOC110441277 [Mizuhopecten yessoensis]|nr:uncharacterized protein LOC110441277 [Mizuhopecten yessoensis]XP_021340063.1 uncharacterized protein LOC110441277 [Mizuhopecten yessoensis]XP_021340064.1 uncharacterized protein LOC110441277 [Mizuhopecten yessoensis]